MVWRFWGNGGEFAAKSRRWAQLNPTPVWKWSFFTASKVLCGRTAGFLRNPLDRHRCGLHELNVAAHTIAVEIGHGRETGVLQKERAAAAFSDPACGGDPGDRQLSIPDRILPKQPAV